MISLYRYDIYILQFWCPILSSEEKIPKCLQDPKTEFPERTCDLNCYIQIMSLTNDEVIHHSIFSANKYCIKYCEVPRIYKGLSGR